MWLDSLHDWLVFNANYSFKISCLLKVTNVKHLHFYDIIQHFPFICSNIPAAPAYGVYISQLIRYSRACGSYQNFLGRELLLTRKLLNQEFLLVNLKSSLRKFYLCHKWSRICSTCRTHFPVLSSFMTYHRVCN
jgi:hypothetical protein